MSDGATLHRLALALDGAVAAPHFDRTAFKVKRTFMTLSADRLTANLKFAPDEQALKCTVLSEAFSPVPNAWVNKAGRSATYQSSMTMISLMHWRAWRHAPADTSEKVIATVSLCFT